MNIERLLFVVGLIVLCTLASNRASALCIFGMGSCEAALITGNYVMTDDPNVTLRIESRKITAQGGPMSISADYTIKSVEKDKLLLEVSAPAAGKENMVVFIRKGGILIRESFVFGGNWAKK